MERGETAVGFGTEARHPLLEFLDVLQLLAQRQTLMRPKAPRSARRRVLLLQTSPRESRKISGSWHRTLIWRSICCPELPQHVGGHRSQLDVRAFEYLLDPGQLARPLLDHRTPVAHQVAQLPLRALGDEAGQNRPMPMQVCDPRRVAGLGLATRQRLECAACWPPAVADPAPPAGCNPSHSCPNPTSLPGRQDRDQDGHGESHADPHAGHHAQAVLTEAVSDAPGSVGFRSGLFPCGHCPAWILDSMFLASALGQNRKLRCSRM